MTTNTKNRKRNIIWFNPSFSLNVSTNIGKKSFSLLGKHFPKTHQLHKLFNRNNVKVSYSSLPNFKSVINGHNKNILNEQEKPSPCNCRDKTSCPLKGTCQHKNLVYSCKVSTPDLKQNHPHYIGLTEHTFKDSTNITILLSTSQKETRQNFLISYGVKRKRRLIWILIRAFQIRHNLLSCLLLQKKHFMSYREISHHFLNKEFVE